MVSASTEGLSKGPALAKKAVSRSRIVGPVVAALTGVLKDKDKYVRINAAWILEKIQKK
jgi:hypothetical protein